LRILVTGSRGKVGSATVTALHDAGHEVTATDLGPAVFERSTGPGYRQADLTTAGDAYAVVRGHDAVIHAAAIPDPLHHPPDRVFHNNLMATFNVLEAAVRWGVPRFVNVSSETVPGFFFPEREMPRPYAPIDEDYPAQPQDPYALAKHFGEQLMDAAIRRSDIRAISIRPSWVQWEGNYERNLAPFLRDPDEPSASFWTYIDVYDLADSLRLAAESDLPGHEVFYIASPDNCAGRPLAEMIRRHHGDAVELRELDRDDASGTSSAKAMRMLRYAPTRSWRDYLTEDGALRNEARDRLERGETGVQRGRAVG
jgi:nucleoside-diphosphate-sugar epimerase